jgi:hypothetical protein
MAIDAQRGEAKSLELPWSSELSHERCLLYSFKCLVVGVFTLMFLIFCGEISQLIEKHSKKTKNKKTKQNCDLKEFSPFFRIKK